MSASPAKLARRAAEREAGRRRPLVYSTKAAIEQSHRLCPGVVIENRVGDAIQAGKLSGEPREGETAAVFLDGGFVALAVRSRSRFNADRKSWLVISVSRDTNPKEVLR